ncbi:hypothetical protein HAX54_019811, partial [Datura stramonium]|nr:hypothetical protein [Datura stramonium]
MCTADISPIQHRSPEALEAQAVAHRQAADPVKRRNTGSIRQTADVAPVELALGHYLDTCVASSVHESVPVTHRLVIGGLLVCSVFCFASVRQWWLKESSCDSL